MEKRLILASGSPRRAKILRALGVAFEVVKTDAPEISLPEDPERTVRENALAKFEACRDAPGSAGAHILAADTIVWMDGRIYGKPRDAAEAKEFLRELSERTHRVFTGMAFDGETRIATSDVTLRDLSEAQIDEYIRRVNPIDRAGAYDIDESGDLVVESWAGSYENIMGLAIEPLAAWLGDGIARGILLHTCCGPCASACVPRLAAAGRRPVMFFSNSNIDTKEEFQKRLHAARIVAAGNGAELVCDRYDHADWLEKVAKGFEDAPEKGARCARCFRYNLERTAQYAAAHGFDAFATSLTVSPHKPSALVFAASADSRFEKIDFKKRDGFKESLERSAALGLYRQDYCGCEFSKRKAT